MIPWNQSPFLSTLIVALTIATILLLRNILHALPPTFQSFVRIRGSADIEASVRLSRDRNLTAVLCLLPMVMLLSRLRIYNPDWMEGFGEEGRFAATAACFAGYMLLRLLLKLWLRPRRGWRDVFTMAARFSYSAFIILVLLLLPVAGILLAAGVNDLTVKWIVSDIIFVYFFIYCIRKAQIFGLACNPFTTFLYLCALEFLPTALFVASAIVA